MSLRIDESVLRRPIGGPDVLREQLRHLLRSSELRSVDLRVLPNAAGAHAGHVGQFVMFGLTEPQMEVGYAETLGGAVYVARCGSNGSTIGCCAARSARQSRPN